MTRDIASKSATTKHRARRPHACPMAMENTRNSNTRTISKKLQTHLSTCFLHPERVLFLDIETTGLSHYYDDITVIGWSIDGRAKTIVKGQNPRALYKDAERAVALVTFNGIRFDVKFIKREYPDISLPETHIDLMYLCRRVGLNGGQKAIEKQLDILYRNFAPDIDGRQAVILWHQYIRGDIDALRSLILYNRIDIAAMGAIFDSAVAQLDNQLDLFSAGIFFEHWSAPQYWTTLPKVTKPTAEIVKPRVEFRDLFGTGPLSKLRVVGIDLTGSERRASGWCLLDGCEASVKLIRTDEELIESTLRACPQLVSIDSPLCLPVGRISVEDDDPGRSRYGIMRESERELKRRGINVYPCLIPSMQKLTARGIRLAQTLRERGVPVIESYPGAAQDIMRIPRKGAGRRWLELGLKEFGISGKYLTRSANHDELDAITSALVGTFHFAGMTEALGSRQETPLIIPKRKRTKHPIVIGISGPISAGKTSMARLLEQRGFAYTRFSLVLDDMLVDMQLPLTRMARQRLGGEINDTGRQRWLCEKAIERVEGAGKIVVDGLRFPEDYSSLAERFGIQFALIYIDADKSKRRTRYINLHNADHLQFEEASAATVEREVFCLKELANLIVINHGSKKDLERHATSIIQYVQGAEKCLYQS